MIRYLLPNNSLHEYMSDKINTRLITSNSLKILIRQGYRDGINSDDGGATLFECIRLLNEQISLSRNTSVKESFDVRIMVTAVYDDSRPTIVHSNIYSYFYRITIENRSQDTVQVLARHLLWQTATSKIEVPRFAEGVIGEKPILEPGQSFQYMSKTNLEFENEGTMEGSFLLLNQRTNEEFEVKMAKCSLNPTVFKTGPR